MTDHENRILAMTFGPLTKDWPHEDAEGLCPECAGSCDGPECGTHVAGCIYGGPTERSSYWLIAEGCPRYHGEADR